MSTVPEITAQEEATKTHNQQTMSTAPIPEIGHKEALATPTTTAPEEATKTQNQQTMSTAPIPEIGHKEALATPTTTAPEEDTKTQNQQTMSTAPILEIGHKEALATPTTTAPEEATKTQNQQTMSTAPIPEIGHKEALATPTTTAPEEDTKTQNQQTMSTAPIPEIGHKEALATPTTTAPEEDTKTQNQQTMSTAPIPEIGHKEALATPTTTAPEEDTKTQNQQTMSTAPIPEIGHKEALATPTTTAPEPANPPPTELDNSAQTNTLNQHDLSSIPEITAEEATATPSSPPKLDKSAQPTDTQNQETLSSAVPEITHEEEMHDLSSIPEIIAEEATATPSSPRKLDKSAQPKDTQNQETLSSAVPEITYEEEMHDLSSIPEIIAEEATATPSSPPKLDKSAQPKDTQNQETLSSAVPEITHEEEMTENQQKSDQNETPKQDSTTITQRQTGTPKIESPNITPPQADKKTDPGATKKDPFCLPLSGLLHRSKEDKPESKTPASVQDSALTPSKDDLSKKPTLAQDSSKDELSKSIVADIKYIEEESSKLDKYKDQVSLLVRDAELRFEELKKVGTEKELRELKKEVTKLKLQIPSKHKADADEKDPHRSQHATGVSKIRQKNIPELVMKQMPQLHKSNLFESSSEVRDFEGLFDGLTVELKLCLLCFSIFPEKAIIKKRLMVHWWIAEGFVPPIPRDDETRQQIVGGKTAEEFADEYFEQLTKMGIIEPVNKKRSLYVGCYTMHPFIRLSLIMLAEKAKFFNFDEEGMPTEKSSGTFQACLSGRGLIDFQDLQKGHVNLQDLEKLHTVFNINEPILDFEPEWFLRMKNLNVLYLGRWKVSATDHIELEETKLLDGLSTMDHLRFFSLQGVSRVVELPDSISQLSNLMILDLRACHDLDSIPEGIRFLRNLTYLDISECYMLEHMPKGLAMLSNLKVLKGFVVGEERDKHTCGLEDLAKLEKLIKLSIYTGLDEFPNDKDLKALQRFKVLKKLTMAWGGGALHPKSNNPKPDNKKEKPKDERKKALMKKQTLGKTLKKLPTFRTSTAVASSLQLEKLEKLDLKSFPKTATPTWLIPSSLKSLKKLYIRGGKFSDLGQYQDLDFQEGTQGPDIHTWKVEILRLKYLNELEMDWRQLQELFPNLIYLEKVNCPKLTFFPSDGYGVWINKGETKADES